MKGNHEMTVKKPYETLAELGAIYKDRNATYGDTYKNFGIIMNGMFPKGLTLNNPEDWCRISIFFHCADKLARYAGAFTRGGHVDSLDDNSVYSQMLQEYDATLREKRKDEAVESVAKEKPTMEPWKEEPWIVAQFGDAIYAALSRALESQHPFMMNGEAFSVTKVLSLANQQSKFILARWRPLRDHP